MVKFLLALVVGFGIGYVIVACILFPYILFRALQYKHYIETDESVTFKEFVARWIKERWRR